MIQVQGKTRPLPPGGNFDMGAIEFKPGWTPILNPVVELLDCDCPGGITSTITFPPGSVTKGGYTTCGIETTGAAPPANYRINKYQYYEITTTAVYTPGDPLVPGDEIEIVLNYCDPTPTDPFPPPKDDLLGSWALQKYNPAVTPPWEPVDPQVKDTVNNTITGYVDSLSTFAILYKITESAIVDIDPDTLNLKSKGKFITCYIELTNELDVNDIRIETISIGIPGTAGPIIAAKNKPSAVGDHDSDGIPDLMVKFDRQEIQSAIASLSPVPSEVTLVVWGDIEDGPRFEGTDSIRIIGIEDISSAKLLTPAPPEDEGEYSSDNDIIFQWKPVENANGYKLQIYTGKNENDKFEVSVSNVLKYQVKDCKPGKIYYGRIKAVGDNTESEWSGSSDGIIVLAEQDGDVTVVKNVINPMNGEEVAFCYSLDKNQKVSIKIYNINGELIKILADEISQAPGKYTAKWNGKSIKGHVVASGVYLVKIKINWKIDTKKVVIIK